MSAGGAHLRFPDGFSWGVSASAFQIEGALADDGRGPSVWDTFCARPGSIANDDDPGRALQRVGGAHTGFELIRLRRILLQREQPGDKHPRLIVQLHAEQVSHRELAEVGHARLCSTASASRSPSISAAVPCATLSRPVT